MYTRFDKIITAIKNTYCLLILSDIKALAPSNRCFLQKDFTTVVDYLWKITLLENCPYSELFSSAFSRIRTEYGEILLNAGKCGPE